jgi:misacylated tRNA(Ala) deacylase
MTEELFRQDAYLTTCDATVLAVNDDGSIILDRTIFYITGGGQPGDSGYLEKQDGSHIDIVTTRKDRETGSLLHLAQDGQDGKVNAGDKVTCHINWETRYKYMRHHTALHLLSVVVPFAVTGGQIGAVESRLDFNIPDPDFDKEGLTEKLMALINQDHAVTMRWITDEEMDAQPELVKTMAVQPPRGSGKVRLVAIGDVDLQPCGGTHVKQTSEIGSVAVTKIENKGKQNRSIRILFVE